MSKGARVKAGRPPEPEPEFPSKPADCDHSSTTWEVKTQIANVWWQPDRTIPLRNDPNRRLTGHVLSIAGVRCNECGQPFRFANVPLAGEPLDGPIGMNKGQTLMTKIEPDVRILTPSQAGPRIIMPSGSRGRKH